MHSRPLLPLEQIAVAVMIERLGGKVVITDADLAAFDRRGELLQYAAPEGGIVLELRRSPFTIAGEVVDGHRALTQEAPVQS